VGLALGDTVGSAVGGTVGVMVGAAAVGVGDAGDGVGVAFLGLQAASDAVRIIKADINAQHSSFLRKSFFILYLLE
jgi:hypothetical protein